MLVDHAFTLPMALLFPGQGVWPVTTVPVCINTVQFPLPSAARCWKLGQAIGRAIQSWDADKRVVVIGTGGYRTSSTASAPASSTRTST
jgi:protocatechuate 4,5-dioxygenase beta chain